MYTWFPNAFLAILYIGFDTDLLLMQIHSYEPNRTTDELYRDKYFDLFFIKYLSCPETLQIKIVGCN